MNYAAHFVVGSAWGVARAVAARAGLSGQPVAAVFAAMWTGDVLGVAALGIDEPPWRWERRDLAIDVVDKLVLAQAIGLTYETQRRSGRRLTAKVRGLTEPRPPTPASSGAV
jgi:hypothetical protein